MSPTTKRCPHCDTALEFESGGQRLAFTAHDEKFCTLVTRDRVRFLMQAMQAEREAYERSVAALRRQTNEMLKRHGISSLEEQAAEHEPRTLRMLTAAGNPRS